MSHPYKDLPPKAFWRSAVSDRSAFQIKELWDPKYRIRKRTRIATAGSCFAQHFSKALVARGYHWVNAEPAPEGLPDHRHADYHFGTFSFRTGNIYTVKMLRQWMEWALTDTPMPEVFWHRENRVYDPFRPAIEPGGFASEDEVRASRRITLAAISEAVRNCDVFVFTMGLTEGWRDRESDLEFAICPGTAAGDFDTARHVFANPTIRQIQRDLRAALKLMRQANPTLQVLLTVSPVPLVATASGQHVLTATSFSKATLRAVAGEMAIAAAYVDYFPSFEIISNPVFRGMFYAPNQRNVDQTGVDFVMQSFFECQAAKFQPDTTASDQPVRPRRAVQTDKTADEQDDIRCEEEILNAFAK
ncbi:GSCFA domain-containing protein [Pseudaestuariivita rosea]|uniref:GSCFA domain-containing protein n=1 Tax=Pseudaestuariivita rosea TaxID=2763263 RepID=UPI001ABB1017|nr:GSCFA domain-containing protein [Pseudaestuariivita rosea]